MIKNIRVGIASFGMSGRIFHAPLLSHRNDFILSQIVERSTNTAQSLYPTVQIGRSFEQLLNNRDIDLIIINTPDDTHFEFARRALEHDKHVVVEKPFAQSVEQSKTLVSIAKERGKLISVFHNRRWDGDFLTVQQLVKEKRVGRLVEFISHFDRYRPVIQSLSWKEQSSHGTGLLYNLGSHMIDQALVLFGMPYAVTAHLGNIRDNATINDWFEVRLHYPDILVRLNSSYLVREEGPRFTLHGTEGSFVKLGIDPQEEQLKNGLLPGDADWGLQEQQWWGILNRDEDGKQVRTIIPTLRGNYSEYYDMLWKSFTEDSNPPVAGLDGVKNLTIIEAAMQSNSEKRTITISKM